MVMPSLGIGTLYSIAKDVRGWFRHRFNKLLPEEQLARREKWKEHFREEIWNREKNDLRNEVIIRDVRRLNDYPELLDKKGISPWFRVALVGQYHRGIELGLSIHSLVFEPDEGANGSWRLADPAEKCPTVKAFLIAYVRYDDIENVDWYGDEYYGCPHIYCHFAHRGEPYDKLAFCEEKSIHPKRRFYTEIASYDEVKLTSAKFGTAKSYW